MNITETLTPRSFSVLAVYNILLEPSPGINCTPYILAILRGGRQKCVAYTTLFTVKNTATCIMQTFEYIKITKHLHVIITFINFTIIALLLLTVCKSLFS